MPYRAFCTICFGAFEASRDVAAIQCGHTFHYDCLLRWFETAPSEICPKCRQASTSQDMTKLFFDKEETTADPEVLQQTAEKQKKDLDSTQQKPVDEEIICATLRAQMSFLVMQQNEMQAAKEEVRSLRVKIQTLESLDVVLQGQRDEVESMVEDIGVSEAAVEQLSMYCISLKKANDTLKGRLKSSNDMREELKRHVFSSNNKLHKAKMEVNQTKEAMTSLQMDLADADKKISSLKKKMEFLQSTPSTSKGTKKASRWLSFESRAPMKLDQPCLDEPSDSKVLNRTYDVTMPEAGPSRQTGTKAKKIRLTKAPAASKHKEKSSPLNMAYDDEDESKDAISKNSHFKRKTSSRPLHSQTRSEVMSSGSDGLGGRMNFIQPPPLSDFFSPVNTEIRITRPQPKNETSLAPVKMASSSKCVCCADTLN